jgi:uncharacterized protein YerC
MFWEKDAYVIAKKLTNNHELHRDLVSHVFILLHKYELEANVLPKMFARFAWNQWNWQQSEFNKTMRFPGLELIEIQDENCETIPNKYQDLMNDFINKIPKDDQELFVKEVTKMHLYGMTYREIKKNTGLHLDTIHKAIKKFKYDLHNYCGCDCSQLSNN